LTVLRSAAGEDPRVGRSLFDVYRGDQVGAEGKKSIAFRLAFRAPDRTLTTDEVSRCPRRCRRSCGGAASRAVQR
jgi:phenylalanyl-tRNA synthetase beta chain